MTSRVSVALDGQQDAGDFFSRLALSADGRFVVFGSPASNLVAGDANSVSDVFVRDRLAGVTERVSVGVDGEGNGPSAGASISADGSLVAFESDATNLGRGTPTVAGTCSFGIGWPG
ncbi:MAG: hypothetical protein ABI873_06775 [Marmoricola sp.]